MGIVVPGWASPIPGDKNNHSFAAAVWIPPMSPKMAVSTIHLPVKHVPDIERRRQSVNPSPPNLHTPPSSSKYVRNMECARVEQNGCVVIMPQPCQQLDAMMLPESRQKIEMIQNEKPPPPLYQVYYEESLKPEESFHQQNKISGMGKKFRSSDTKCAWTATNSTVIETPLRPSRRPSNILSKSDSEKLPHFYDANQVHVFILFILF